MVRSLPDFLNKRPIVLGLCGGIHWFCATPYKWAPSALQFSPDFAIGFVTKGKIQ
jgi:hypothetical protein